MSVTINVSDTLRARGEARITVSAAEALSTAIRERIVADLEKVSVPDMLSEAERD